MMRLSESYMFVFLEDDKDISVLVHVVCCYGCDCSKACTSEEAHAGQKCACRLPEADS